MKKSKDREVVKKKIEGSDGQDGCTCHSKTQES